MNKVKAIIAAAALLLVVAAVTGYADASNPKSGSGVQKTDAQVTTDSAGHTMEQNNVAKRLQMDNKPGSIKYLYILSPFNGQVIIYSTVKGKVTSSGKRLNPYKVTGPGKFGYDYFNIDIGGERHRTAEVLQDDGTYGESAPYIYWWDTKGIYHQHYVSDDQIAHISDQPLVVSSVIINLDMEQPLTATNATK